MPEVGRFISPDTLVPDPENPQSYNRYSYGLNSPVNFTDPTGHCFDPTTAPICLAISAGTGPAAPVVLAGALTVSAVVIGVADLASPTFNPVTDTVYALSELSQQVSDQISYQLRKSSGKPLTEDEKDKIGKIDQVPEWLEEHPDLAEEAEIVAEGGTLPKGKNHVREANERVRSLDNAIEVLQGVRRSRDAEARQEIDAALERARNYRQQLLDILGGAADSRGRRLK